MSKVLKSLWHPKYWLSWLLVGLLFVIIRIFPKSWLRRLGRLIGSQLDWLMPYRMLVAKTNLKACFTDNWKVIYQQHKLAVGSGFFEMAMGWFLPKSYFKTKIRYEGFEYVESLLETRGVMLLGMHTTSLDYGAQFISAHLPVHFMYKPARNAVLDWVITRARASNGCQPIAQKDIRQVLNRLSKKQCVWYGCDQDFGVGSKSVFVSFFGIEALTLPLYAKIAKKADAYVVPITGFWDDQSGDFVVRFLPKLDIDNLSDKEAAKLMNQSIEHMLSGFESQYYWVHRRFKNRPDNSPAFYPLKRKSKKKH